MREHEYDFEPLTKLRQLCDLISAEAAARFDLKYNKDPKKAHELYEAALEAKRLVEEARRNLPVYKKRKR